MLESIAAGSRRSKACHRQLTMGILHTVTKKHKDEYASHLLPSKRRGGFNAEHRGAWEEHRLPVLVRLLLKQFPAWEGDEADSDAYRKREESKL